MLLSMLYIGVLTIYSTHYLRAIALVYLPTTCTAGTQQCANHPIYHPLIDPSYHRSFLQALLTINPALLSILTHHQSFPPWNSAQHISSSTRISSPKSSMSIFSERLASFIAWPHASPTPQDLARAGWSFDPDDEYPDNVTCKACDRCQSDRQPEFNPKLLYVCHAKSCSRRQDVTPRAPLEVPPQAAPQPIEYHHCKLYNASFSSMARLIHHTQESICNKPSYRRCEMVISSKNRLHQQPPEEC